MTDAASQVGPLKAWTTVLILFTLSAVAWMDRSVLAMLVTPLKQHFGIGDFQVSLLGSAFAIFYILALVPIGAAADRYSRRLILFCGVMIWSIATAWSGVAANFTQMFAARMMVGAGEASVQPVAGPLIRQLFGREHLAGPISVYSLGASTGSAVGVVVAGDILAWGSARGPISIPYFGILEPWQMVLMALGLPGLAIAFLAFGVAGHRPRSTAVAASAAPLVLTRYLRRARGYWLTALGFVTTGAAVNGVIYWTPAYLARRFELTPPYAGRVVALIAIASPLLFQVGAAVLVNRMIRRGTIDAPLRVMRWALAAALPAALLLWLAPTVSLYTFAVFLLMALLFVANPLGIMSIQLIAPVPLSSRLTAIYVMLLALIGVGAGSSIVGFLSQYVVGEDRLNAAMGITALCAIAASGLLLTAALRPMRQSVLALNASDTS